MTHDAVNHPTHYTSDPSGVECIEVTRHRNFAIGNAIKYLWRAGLKDENTSVQDLRKAIWYIEDEIKRLERESAAEGKTDPESSYAGPATLANLYNLPPNETVTIKDGKIYRDTGDEAEYRKGNRW